MIIFHIFWVFHIYKIRINRNENSVNTKPDNEKQKKMHMKRFSEKKKFIGKVEEFSNVRQFSQNFLPDFL